MSLRQLFIVSAAAVALALLLAAGVSPSSGQAAPLVSTTLLVSQVQTGSGSDADVEFIEIYNASGSDINLNGYKVVYRSASGFSDLSVYTFAASDVIPAHGHFLLVHQGKSVGAAPDATFTTSIGRAGGGLAIRDAGDAIVDSLGWGSATNIFVEGSPAMAAPNDQSMERKPGGSLGNGTDTDNNLADFQVLVTPDPRNTASPAAPPLGGLMISKAAPASVEVGQAFAYTLTVGNYTGGAVHTLVITDALPLSATIASISNSGVDVGQNVVSWTVASLADNASITRTVIVTAPGAPATLSNADYAAWASDWPTKAVGIPVNTSVVLPGQVVPIGTARGMMAQIVTVSGRAIMYTGGFYAGGGNTKFYVQDSTGGIAVQCFGSGGTLPVVTLGDLVTVTGQIGAYNNEVQIVPADNVADVEVVNGAPSDVPAPLIKAISQVDDDPDAVGWLVNIQGTATRVATYTYSYEVDLSDGQGHMVLVYLDANTGATVAGVKVGTSYVITGIVELYRTEYEVKPRLQADIARYVDKIPPTLVSTVPANDASGASLYRPLEAVFSEPISPTTISTATFTLQGPAGAVDGAASYDEPARKAVFAPLAPLAPLARYTATLTTGITDLAGNALQADYVWSFDTGEADTTPPFITAHYPLANATGVLPSANIVVTFSEDVNPATLPGNVYLAGPYGAIPAAWTYDSVSAVLTLNPLSNLLPTTRYTATVEADVADWAGLTLGADTVWSFETSAELPMQAYHGDIHNHTSYSDGSGTPTLALATGKAAGFDFMAITDHSYAVDDGEWSDTLSAVNAATQDGVFVALRGFEYTQGAEGHLNVYNTVRHACRADTGFAYCDYTPNLERGVTVDGFYHWLSVTGTHALDSAGTVMQFNHPGWINFNDWTFHPEVSDTARLEEVGNGSGSSYAFSEDEYIRSLDYGWKVGATNNADTHSFAWGTNTPHRTGVWMPDLTRSDLMEALRERRTFATEDRNYDLYLKANGVWMGQIIPNTGQLVFEIYGNDPDGEFTAFVQLITNHGEVVAQTTLGATFTWQPVLNIAPGAHYYYVKVTQADGERIVSSPVWTEGAQDVSITDLTLQPTIPTIYNPSLFMARVTNRGQTTQTVTVTLRANATVIDVIPVTVGVCSEGPCSDGYANVTWQPAVTGPVTVTASLSGAPVGDNPDDNSRELHVVVTDEKIPLVLIDNGHGNIGSAPRDARLFVADLTDHGYNVLFNLDDIAASDLNTETVKLLIINAYGPDQLTADEINAIADFVAAGGSLWLNGMSDYAGKVVWANTVADRLNDLVASIETRVGADVPIRMNDDEVLDGNNNNGYPWGVLWHIYPVSETTGMGVNVIKIQSWSICSLMDNTGDALTASDLGSDGFIVALGDLDEGYTPDYYHNPYHTANTDADEENDAYVYNPTWVYPASAPPNPIPLPGAAGYDIPGAPGRIFFYGDSNDPFNVFAYTAGDGKQNELFNLQVVMWLLGEPLHKSTVAQARADAELNNTPDNLDKLVWVEGEITSGYGEFFNVLYVQDDTGGVTVHAPAGDIEAAQYARGAYVRAIGTVGIYNGDTEIEFFEAEQVQIITPTSGVEPAPIPMSTHDAALESNEGWLVEVTGTVTSKIGDEAIIVDDGSGPIRAFLDGYNGDFSDVDVERIVSVRGLVSEDGEGRRIRVRNHNMHPQLADDVTLLEYAPPTVVSVSPADGATGVVVTATIQATFSSTMTNVSASTFLLRGPAGQVAGMVTYNAAARTATLTPSAPLAYETRYTATLLADLASSYGVTLTSDYVWSFTTRVAKILPTLVSVSPADGATGVVVTATVQATFNSTMTNISASTFLLQGPAGQVAGAVAYDAGTKTATLAPSAPLAYETRYTATLLANLANHEGMTLVLDYVWSFTTRDAPPQPPTSYTVYLPLVMRNY